MNNKHFDPKSLEQKWSAHWESLGAYKPNPKAKVPYCIVIPPPNVTGSLHMGHAFQYTIMDLLIRYHRMQGKKVLWQMGMDHAGIATQMVVERQLQAQKLSRTALGREKFIQKIWDWKNISSKRIREQIRSLGASVDWDRERFTLDETLSAAVQKVFIELYEDGLIYRGQKLVNWDPVLQTAVSDLEVQNKEESGHLWHIRYPIANSTEHLVIATTRPETLLGDTAVAVHPKDTRYQKWIGQKIQHPLTNRLIPIIADEYVDPEFGTGCLKITPAHDFNDYEIGQRHGLDSISILDKHAKINTNAPERYQTLDRFVARKKIIAELESMQLLEKVQPHVLQIPYGDRSHAVLEPLLTDQWFVKIGPLAKEAIEVVQSKEIQFIPENWSKTYFEWMHNVQDWCISRQIWWGHRIPAWYDPHGNVYVGENLEAIRKKYALEDEMPLTQEEDVLDTWFSSALWPFSALGWPKNTEDFNTFYPNNVLVTGFDIIFFWVARMIMFGLKFAGTIPFSTIYMHGLIQDHEGQKMSKSKGNILDPIDLIEGIALEPLLKKRTENLMQPQMAKSIIQKTKKQFPNGIDAFGTDALRFTYCLLATNARHLRFDIKRLEDSRNFCNKLWNATRFILMHTKDFEYDSNHTLNLPDRWILSRWQKVKQSVQAQIENYRFDLLAHELYDFVWHEYCDWYLELAKPILAKKHHSEAERKGTCHTLLHVLEEVLKTLHPIMPFITEEIWQTLASLMKLEGQTIMLASFPQANVTQIKEQIEIEMNWMKQFILSIRQIRGEMNISPKVPLSVYLQQGDKRDKLSLESNRHYLTSLANLKGIEWEAQYEGGTACATGYVGKMALLIPLAGLVDTQAEMARLEKEIEKLNKIIASTEKQMNNPEFLKKAPKAVLEKTQKILRENQQTKAMLCKKLQMFS